MKLAPVDCVRNTSEMILFFCKKKMTAYYKRNKGPKPTLHDFCSVQMSLTFLDQGSNYSKGCVFSRIIANNESYHNKKKQKHSPILQGKGICSTWQIFDNHQHRPLWHSNTCIPWELHQLVRKKGVLFWLEKMEDQRLKIIKRYRYT